MEDCIFCKIVRGDIPVRKTYEDELVIAFPDIKPVVPGHTLVIPKEHHPWFWEVPPPIAQAWFAAAQTLARALKEEHGADYVQMSIVGKDVPHAHIHLMPRTLKDTPKL